MVTRKTIFGLLALTLGLMVALQAGGQETERVKLDDLVKVYEPVDFSHGVHSQIAEDCAVCHHNTQAGQTPSCSQCHQPSTASKGTSIPGLKDAYHGQCMGCHKEIEMGPTGCSECHAKRTVSVPTSVPGEKQAIKPAQKGPETCTLNSLEKKYEPVLFSHGIHADMTDGCNACHHHSPSDQTPACSECHGEPFNPENLNMPGLKGAYHLQCMGCHRELKAGPAGCTECHAKKTGGAANKEKI